jgi:hypothetical protein
VALCTVSFMMLATEINKCQWEKGEKNKEKYMKMEAERETTVIEKNIKESKKKNKNGGWDKEKGRKR